MSPHTPPIILDEHVEELFEAAPDALVAINRNGTIKLVNNQLERVTGWRRDELLGKPVEMLVPEGLREAHVTHRAEYIAAPRTREMGTGLRLELLRADDTLVPVDISLSARTFQGELLIFASIRTGDLKLAQAADVAAVNRRFVRRWVLLGGLGFVMLDLAVTLTVVIILSLNTRQADRQNARRACANTAYLAKVEHGIVAEQQQSTAGLAKQGFTFGLPKAKFNQLVAQSKIQAAAQLTALDDLATANCKSLKLPVLPTETTTARG